MDRGRILILGQTKENSYEIRNLLDNHRFELEIALSKEMGKTILSTRMMHLLVLHTEAIDEETPGFFEYLNDRGISIPVIMLGEDTAKCREKIESDVPVQCFEKPYPVHEVLSYIERL